MSKIDSLCFTNLMHTKRNFQLLQPLIQLEGIYLTCVWLYVNLCLYSGWCLSFIAFYCLLFYFIHLKYFITFSLFIWRALLTLLLFFLLIILLYKCGNQVSNMMVHLSNSSSQPSETPPRPYEPFSSSSNGLSYVRSQCCKYIAGLNVETISAL